MIRSNTVRTIGSALVALRLYATACVVAPGPIQSILETPLSAVGSAWAYLRIQVLMHPGLWAIGLRLVAGGFMVIGAVVFLREVFAAIDRFSGWVRDQILDFSTGSSWENGSAQAGEAGPRRTETSRPAGHSPAGGRDRSGDQARPRVLGAITITENENGHPKEAPGGPSHR